MNIKYFLLSVVLAIATISYAQDDIVINLDSIKNIKATRYSSVNEVGVGINIANKVIQKFENNTQKRKVENEKPSFIFRTVHGILINPKIFIGAGTGIDFRQNGTYGTRFYYMTFPFFAEFREYFLKGNFNMYLSQRLGAAIFLDTYFNKSFNNGKYTGAFGEFMLGGRYVTGGKKIAINFGVGYRLQHLQRKLTLSYISNGTTQSYPNTPEITLKHYVPIVLGVTF